MKEIRPWKIGHALFLPDYKLCGFLIKINYKKLNKISIINEIVKIFSKRKIPILEVKASIIPDKLVEAIIFVDLSSIKTRRIIDKMIKELNLLSHVKEVQAIRPITDDIVVDDLHFPPMFMGKRALIFSKCFYKSFVRGGYAKFGDVFSSWLYVIGSMIGKDVYNSHFEKCFRQTNRSESERLSIMIQLVIALFKHLGFGIAKIDKLDLNKNEVIVRVYHSFECELLKENKKASSHFIRGLLAGWFSELCGKELFAEEVECIGKGDESCKFRIAEKPHPVTPLRLYSTSHES